MVLENYLDHLVAVTKQDCLLGSFPFFYVGNVVEIRWTRRCVGLCKVENHWLELAICFKVRLEMLEQHNFFADRSWIVEKVVFVYLLDGGAIVNFVTHSIDVDKMK